MKSKELELDRIRKEVADLLNDFKLDGWSPIMFDNWVKKFIKAYYKYNVALAKISQAQKLLAKLKAENKDKEVKA